MTKMLICCFFFQAEDGIRDVAVTGVQTCALPICVVAASLAGRDASTDLAVLKCAEATSPGAEATDAASIKPGSLALVVGRTRASGPVAALGAVSLVVAERRAWTGAALAPYIRLDIGVQPTAVGGAVIDAHARVVGIATPRFARFGSIAVPATKRAK